MRKAQNKRVKTIKRKYGKSVFKDWGCKGGNPHLKKGGYRYG